MSALVERVRRAVPGRAAPAPPPAEPAAADRAPDWVADGTPAGLRTELESLIGGDGVLSSALDLVRYASDASPYRRIPRGGRRSRVTSTGSCSCCGSPPGPGAR